MIKSCSVFGHSEIIITEELESSLFNTFEYLIQKGCEFFYFGGFGMFDELCHKIVSSLKEKYPHIKRIYCLSDIRYLNKRKRPKYLKDEDYEEFIFLDLDFNWWYKRIYYRNCAMIDMSDIVVFYVEERENSGAYKTYKYAKLKKKQIINLFKK